MDRQAELEAIASALLDANPGLTAARAVQIAAARINELLAYAAQWDRDAAIAYALRQPLARPARAARAPDRSRDLARAVADRAGQLMRERGACPLCAAVTAASPVLRHRAGCPLEAYLLAR